MRLVRGLVERATVIQPDFTIRFRAEEPAVASGSVNISREVRIGTEILRYVVHTHREIRIESALIVLLQVPALFVRAIAGRCLDGPWSEDRAVLGHAFAIGDTLEGIRGAVGNHLPLVFGVQWLAGGGRFGLSIAEDQAAVGDLETNDDEIRLIVARISFAVFVGIGLIRICNVGAIVAAIGNCVFVRIGAHAHAHHGDGANVAMAAPIRKIIRDSGFARGTFLGFEWIHGTSTVITTGTAGLVFDHAMRHNGANIVSRDRHRSAFVSIAAEISILDDLAIDHKIDLARHRDAIFFHINRDRMGAIRVRLRADRPQPIQTHVPRHATRITFRGPIASSRRILTIVHQTAHFVEPNRRGLDQLLVRPRFHRLATRFARFTVHYIIRFICPFRPRDANYVESAFGHGNLARRVEFVDTIPTIPLRHGTISGVTNGRLGIEVDHLDERSDFGEGRCARWIEMRDGRGDATISAARETRREQDCCKGKTHGRNIAQVVARKGKKMQPRHCFFRE